MQLFAHCLMPTHWHLVLFPKDDGDLSGFMHWLTVTHAVRWHLHHGTTGTGHLYQNRFKAFPVETETYFLTLCRYVERNPVRANLVTCAEHWRWSSLWWRNRAGTAACNWLSEWPVERPLNWIDFVNEPLTGAELAAVRRSVVHGAPYGSPTWQTAIAQQLGLEHTLRPAGRTRRA